MRISLLLLTFALIAIFLRGQRNLPVTAARQQRSKTADDDFRCGHFSEPGALMLFGIPLRDLLAGRKRG